jgi:anti-anti-sigma regulatory factor
MPAIAASGCDLDVERGPGWLLVRVRNFDAAESDEPSLAERVWSLLQQHFTYRVVLELDDLQVLNSYLVGQLIQLHRWIEERDGVMRVCGLSPYNRQVLHASHLDDRLLPYGDRQEAVMGGPHTARPR